MLNRVSKHCITLRVAKCQAISSDFLRTIWQVLHVLQQVVFIIMHCEQDSSIVIISSSKSEGDQEGTDELQPSVHKVHSVDDDGR